MTQSSWRIFSGLTLLSASLFCLLSEPVSVTAQAQIVIPGMPFGRGGLDESNFGEVDVSVLKTDPELETILEQAKRFQDDGNFRVATKLMQAVLERSGDALYSDDEQVYFSLVRQVEQQLAELPAEGLAAYRLEADADAKAIVSAGEQGNLANALNQVVNTYFICSIGDEAAFRLGRLYLDQYDFVSARRVFEKALQHPDLSIERNQVLSHIALCDLFLNDIKSAKQSAQQLLNDQPGLRLAQLVNDEVKEIESGGSDLSSVRQNRTGNWEMSLASGARYGVGLPLNERMLCDELVSAFQFYFDPNVRATRSTGSIGEFLAGSRAYGKDAEKTQSNLEANMLSKRQKYGWRPTGMLLFGSDQVYFKTAVDMVALKKSELPIDIEASRASNLIESMISWRSLWKNSFQIDTGTASRTKLVARFGRIVHRSSASSVNNPIPNSIAEVWSYGDSISAQFSLHNDVLYSIEGMPANKLPSRAPRRRQNFLRGQSFKRSRSNFLVAYDLAQEGKVLWTLPRSTIAAQEGDTPVADDDAETEKFLTHGGLMGSPVGFQNSIIAAVNINGAIWIYAFDPSADGATLWKSYLCDEPTAGANTWSAINVSVDGSDVLVSCGLGVVFVLDAATGQIRIARRYERGGAPDGILGNGRWPGVKKMAFDQGWSSDTIIPYGRQMICFSSDASVIESIHRQTGKTIWKSDFRLVSQKLDYILGVFDGVLYVAGPKTIAAFDLDTREHIWGGDDLFEGDVSLGKGILTQQGVFVPVGKQILHFDLMPKELTTQPTPLRKISVDLGGADVGNLFSDGDRFWVHGGNRIYALEAKPE